jgi:hypothetical protein
VRAIAAVTVLGAALIAVPSADASAVFTRHCPAGRWNTYPPFASTARDLIAGPLRVVAFKGLFARAEAEDVTSQRPGGPKVLKAAINILGGRDVTVIVPRAERRVLSLDYRPRGGAAPRTVAGGRSAVRFETCPHGRRTSTGYAGGWLYSGPWPRCVRVNFRVEGRPGVIRRRVPLGAGRCAQPR